MYNYVEHFTKCIENSSRHYFNGPELWLISLSQEDKNLFDELVQSTDYDYLPNTAKNDEAKSALRQIAVALKPKLRLSTTNIEYAALIEAISKELIISSLAGIEFKKYKFEKHSF